MKITPVDIDLTISFLDAMPSPSTIQPIPTFLINLDRSADRLSAMRESFGKVGLGFERIAAVDGHELGEAERAAFLDGNKNTFLEPEEIGVFLSHFATWKRIAREGHLHAAIFEDDITISDNLPPLLRDTRWIPDDADLIKLEALDECDKKLTLSSRAWPIPNGFVLRRLFSRHVGAAGYVVTRRGARRLVEFYPNMVGPVDHDLFDPECATFARLTTYQVVPALCIQSHRGADVSTPKFQSLIPRRRYSKSIVADVEAAPAAKAQSATSKIVREIKRPFIQFASYYKTTLPGLLLGTRIVMPTSTLMSMDPSDMNSASTSE